MVFTVNSDASASPVTDCLCEDKLGNCSFAKAVLQANAYGGGIFANVGAVVQLKNTILAENILPGLFSQRNDCSGVLGSDGYNLN